MILRPPSQKQKPKTKNQDGLTIRFGFVLACARVPENLNKGRLTPPY